MSIIDTLVTNRTEQHVNRLKAIMQKPMSEWTADEAYYYFYGGDPLVATDGELFATDGALYVEGDGVQRGAYNATDLNRVGEACAYLYGKITNMGYTVTGYTALKTDWTLSDVPTAAQMTTYLNTINALKAVFGNPQTIPNSMDNFDYEGANNIEKLINDIYNTADGVKRVYVRSNMITAVSGMGFYIKNEEG